MKIRCLLPLIAATAWAQVLPSADILKPKPDSWPTFHGDYTGQRFSPLKQINTTNVASMSLAWIYRAVMNPGANIGGPGPDPSPTATANIAGTPLMVKGILYLTANNNVWAIDARTGLNLWHYTWKGVPSVALGNRGAAIYGDWLYFETYDNHLVSLDIKTGKERWNKEIADVKMDYFSSMAPVVVGNHVIVGVGGDLLDIPCYVEARDPETGEVQWHYWTTAQKGDPGFNTWPDQEAAAHGGGGVWYPPTYDPDLNLLYVVTGNVNPVMAGQSRAGDNLYTCSVVALNPDTGKMAWYYQYSAHDTHDWDAAQTPVLINGTINGQPRKLLAQAYRGGLFYVLDRTNGKNILTKPYVENLNWYTGINANGQPIRDPNKDATVPGSLVSPSSNGATGWPNPTFSPDTGLFYVGTSQNFTIFYLTDTDPHPEGYGASERGGGTLTSELRAIDYKTGNIVWKRKTGVGAQSLMSTAGGLLFGRDGYNNFIAYDAKTGDPLWHSGLLANPSNGPITYMLDGRQFVVVGAGENLYAFALQGTNVK